MQQLVIGLLLEDGARGLGRILSGVAVGVVLVLLCAVTLPVLLVIGPPMPAAPHGVQPPGPTAGSIVGAVLPAGLGTAPVDIAHRYLGVKYVFGGSDPAVGLDCSGLVQLVFRQVGSALPRTAQQQFDATVRVPLEQLQPGDLVFFARTYADPHDWITHVGIYVGGGLQINAPTEGQVVSTQPVFSGFWGAHYAGAGRVRAA
jgi:cell wall-associated NlpC family hydrolase